jgi:hypothetical protein
MENIDILIFFKKQLGKIEIFINNDKTHLLEASNLI